MSLDKLALIIAVLAITAGLTIWVAGILLAAIQAPVASLLLLPFGVAMYLVARVIGERAGNREEDHYDRIKH